jgi:hypothetical protein
VTDKERFLDAPSRKRNCHRIYRGWFFALATMPESAYGEMLLGSLYRRLGLAVATEREVAGHGSALARRLNRKTAPEGARLEPRLVRAVMRDALDYPRTPSQSSKRSLTVLPLVPEMANYAAPVRLRGNPWNPGNLIAEAVVAGASNEDHAREIWHGLYEALSIGRNEDVWAKFVAEEMQGWRTTDLQNALDACPPSLRALGATVQPESHLGQLAVPMPARQFVHDIAIVIRLKPALTRREWLGYLESLLRLGAVSHSQWLCRVHDVVWTEVMAALQQGHVRPRAELEQSLRTALTEPWMAIGEGFAARSRTISQGYLRARYGLNLLLFEMEQSRPTLSESLPRPTSLPSLADLVFALCRWASSFAGALPFRRQLAELVESDPSVAACRKGFTNNLREFWLYGLAKRQPQLPRDSEFDQGYWLEKRGAYRSAPWITMPGAVSLCLAAHSACRRAGGFGTVRDLSDHFAAYGIDVLQTDFEGGRLAARLRGLGLVVDSPDAESGMAVLDPWAGVY